MAEQEIVNLKAAGSVPVRAANKKENNETKQSKKRNNKTNK